jgi:peptide/nickel transport system substrate-binding protein
MERTSKMIIRLSSIVVMTIFLFACSEQKKEQTSDQRSNVVIHALSDPENLNAFTSSDAHATQIKNNIYQSLLHYDFATMELTPVLASSRGEIELINNNSGMKITFKIRPEARWDNGEPVTVADVIFSLKALKCPKVNSDAKKPYLEFVTDIQSYDEDDHKLSFICNQVYMLAEDVVGYDLNILPEHIFDPGKILRNFSIGDFVNPNEKIINDPRIKTFADEFNSERYGRDPETIQGSGAYRLTQWQTGQRLVLERKKGWWGDQLKGENMFFEANAPKITYEIINDINTALTALKAGKLDVMMVTPVKDYIDLDNSPKFKENFIKSEPDMLAFQYIGLNVRDKILSDKKVRQALAHLTNVDQINEKVLYGKGKRVVGPILPQFKDAYASELPLYQYNPAKAQQLLTEAGWKDTDGDGILDKIINGQKTPLKLTFTYNQGNSMRETVGLMFKEWLRQAGIEMEVRSLEWSLYLGELKKQKIQVFYGSWVTDPRDDDPKQIWHTASRNGGSNYTGFGNAATDAMIDKIKSELNQAKRNQLYHEWQALLHEEVPYIFLNNQPFRNAIHQRFDNINPSSVYPGYYEAGFRVKK